MSIEERAKRVAEKIEAAGLLSAIRYTEPCPARTSGIWIEQDYEAAKKELVELILSEFSQPDVRDEQQKPPKTRLEWEDGNVTTENFELLVFGSPIDDLWYWQIRTVPFRNYIIGNTGEEKIFNSEKRSSLVYDCKSQLEAQLACEEALRQIYESLKGTFGE